MKIKPLKTWFEIPNSGESHESGEKIISISTTMHIGINPIFRIVETYVVQGGTGWVEMAFDMITNKNDPRWGYVLGRPRMIGKESYFITD